jgi:vancomycin resistance protein YoaR
VTQSFDEHHTSPRPRPTNRHAGRGSSRQDSAARRGLYIALAVFAVLVVIIVLVDVLSSAGRVHPGVRVGGVKVGGKTPPDAVLILKAELPKKAAVPLTVTQGATTWTVKASDVDASFDYGQLAANAMSVGREGPFTASLGQRLKAWFGGVSLPASATADSDKLKATIERISTAIDVAPKDAVLKVTADGVTMKPSATGVAVDRARLQSDLLGAFAADSRIVAVHADTAQPKINDAAAKSAQAVVEGMISGPATITYKTKSWPLSVDELAKMITFTQVETSGTPAAWILDPVIGAKEASKTLVPKVGVALGTPPKSARFTTSGGSVSIVPSKDGIGPDIEEFSASLTTVLKNPARGRSVELRTKITPPKLTTDAARDMGIRERLSTFTTTYSSGVPERVNNIHVLGSALDGKLVAPGASFSLNGAVGERTAAKGYKEANAIVKGKLVPQLGGGICQVATTLFNAVFLSGFPVTERINHSFYISHYPTGRDATVSWGGPDLRWKNDSKNWVLVSVSYSSDSITVSLYGTDPGYTVSSSTGPFTNIVPFKTIKVSDPTKPVGSISMVDSGVDGKKVVVTRTVKKNGAVLRTDTFTSNYTPKNETINVGTKGTGSKPATSTPTPKKP